MAITTLEQVKAINNITITDYDALITAGIPAIAELVFEITNNYFIPTNEYEAYDRYGRISKGPDYGYSIIERPKVYVNGEYVFNTDKTITGTGFSEFQAGDDIYIYGSVRNNGYFTIDTVTDTVITVIEALATEIILSYIYFVQYPSTISIVAARMIGYDILKRIKAEGLESQRVGNWSGKYIVGDRTTGYPSDMTGSLMAYALMRGI